jgi:hypothetical protein
VTTARIICAIERVLSISAAKLIAHVCASPAATPERERVRIDQAASRLQMRAHHRAARGSVSKCVRIDRVARGAAANVCAGIGWRSTESKCVRIDQVAKGPTANACAPTREGGNSALT